MDKKRRAVADGETIEKLTNVTIRNSLIIEAHSKTTGEPSLGKGRHVVDDAGIEA